MRQRSTTASQAAAGADAPAAAASQDDNHIADTPFPPGTLPVDEYTGVGGDYIVGEDGKRRPASAPISETAEPPAAA
jgi:hypothetical protein